MKACWLLLVGLLVAALGACDDGGVSGPSLPDLVELAVVLNSVDRTLTVFPVADPATTRTIGLGPDGSPATLAARGSIVAVPLGIVPALAVVDLARGEVERTIALAAGSGATGVAFVNDSIALVANPDLDTVTPVNVRRGTLGADIPTGGFPQAILAAGGRAYVLNAELGPDFLPARSGTITAIDGATLAVAGTIELTGANPGSATVGPDGRLYVVNAGSFGQADGSLSVVSTAALEEVEHHAGFGDFPGAVAFDPAGRLLVSAFSFGIAVWDPAADAFVRPPDAALEPGGIPSSSGVGVDGEGRIWALEPDCQNPADVFRIDAAGQVLGTVPAGTCPIGIAFTTVEEEG